MTSAIVERAAPGDTEGFRELVIRCHGLIRAICLAHARGGADAEDLTQEVFLRVHHDLPTLRDPSRFKPWLRRVATNVCLQWLRRNAGAPLAVDEVPEVADPRVEESLRRREMQQIVCDTLGEVSANNREVLALHYLAGCSETEIAEALALAPSTVKSRLYEGRKQAKRRLLPLVEEFLRLESGSAAIADQIIRRCGSPGCSCPDTLTEGR